MSELLAEGDPDTHTDVPLIGGARVTEALNTLRFKPVLSTTLERMRVTRVADDKVAGLPQPRQLAEGMFHLLDNIACPVAPSDLLLGRIDEEVPDEQGEAFFQESVAQWKGRGLPSWMGDTGHECLAWDRLLELGLSGLQQIAQDELDRRVASGEEEKFLEYLRGAIGVYGSLRRYAERYADAGERVGLTSSSACCRHIADHPPSSFAEALQLMWLVGGVYCTMVSMNPTMTFGRVDELLLDFYLRDISAGAITEAEAGDLIEDFYCKNNLILGRGEHQMGGDSEKDTGWIRNLSYDSPQYVVLGGRRSGDSAVANELTALFIERIVPRFENPVVVIRYTSDMPESLWRMACAKMRENASMMVYSDDQIIPAMIGSGMSAEEAVTYTMHGCNWPDIPGIQRAVQTQFIQLPRILRAALVDGGGEERSLESVYDEFQALLRSEIKAQTDGFREFRDTWADRAPGRLRVDDCFLDGPIVNARSWKVGGVKYTNMILSVTGLASATDSMTALDELVFGGGKVPLARLRAALDDDFGEDEHLRQLCLHTGKYGQGDSTADAHAVRLLDIVNREIDEAARLGTADELNLFRCLETDMRHIPFGRGLGATPDGRHADEPISENTSPTPGACINGPTAMFRSMSKLPFDRINSGALNLRMQPAQFKGEEGLDRLAHLLRTYFEMGGLQVQLSFASVEELRDAQKHPERYRDLMVRITGYSAAFVDMTREAQDEIIRREEMGC